MQIWRAVLALDDRLNLTSFERSREWLKTLKFGQGNAPRPAFYLEAAVFLRKYVSETSDEMKQWSDCVMVFREFVRRLKGVKPKREPSLASINPDRFFHGHISCLSPMLVYDGHVIKDVRGVMYLPTNADGTWKVRNFADACSQFWQCVYGSICFDTFAGVCGQCGISLGVSRKTGKSTRSEYCKNCREKLRWRNMPAKKRREANRIKVAKYRAKRKLKKQRGEA